MSKKLIDLGPNSEVIVPSDIVTAVSSESTDGQVPSAKCVDKLVGDVESVLDAVNAGGGGGHQGWIYGYIIDESDSNPATRVSYIEDNADFDPLYMDFANDTLVWGGWKSFVEEYFRPAMLKSDGTIDYYLDPYDLTKKSDGETASDVANANYDGNAMVIVKPIYWHIRRDGNSVEVKFSNVKQNGDWYCWTHLKSDGSFADFCAWGIYGGTTVNNVLRSMSTNSFTTNYISNSNQISYATANGSNWYPFLWSDVQLIRLLFPLLTKSTSTNDTIGLPYASSSGTLTDLKTGALNAKGSFYGHHLELPNYGSQISEFNHGTKFLGMENLWGDRWLFAAGILTARGNVMTKMTPSTVDGSGANFICTRNTENIVAAYVAGEPGLSWSSSQELVPQNISVDPRTATLPVAGWQLGANTYGKHYVSSTWTTKPYGEIVGDIIISYGFEFMTPCYKGFNGGVFGCDAAMDSIDSGNSQNRYGRLSYHFF